MSCAWVGVDAKKIGVRREVGGRGKVCRQGSGNVGFYPAGARLDYCKRKEKIQTRALSLRLGLTVFSAVLSAYSVAYSVCSVRGAWCVCVGCP